MDPLLLVIFGIVAVTSVLGIFFEKLWKVFPFAERRPLVIWLAVMTFFILLAFIV